VLVVRKLPSKLKSINDSGRHLTLATRGEFLHTSTVGKKTRKGALVLAGTLALVFFDRLHRGEILWLAITVSVLVFYGLSGWITRARLGAAERIGRSIFLLVICITCVSLYVWHFWPESSDSKPAPANPNSVPSTPPGAISPDLAKDILEQLQQIRAEARQKNLRLDPFIVAGGPTIIAMKRNGGSIFAGPELPPRDPGPVVIDHVDLYVYAAAMNQQLTPTLIDGYQMEVQNRLGKWEKLLRVDAVGRHIYWRSGYNVFNSMDGGEPLFDTAIYRTTLKSGSTAYGWMLFQYPSDINDVEPGHLKLRLTVYSLDRKHSSGYIPRNDNDSTRTAMTSWGPAIQLPPTTVITQR